MAPGCIFCGEHLEPVSLGRLCTSTQGIPCSACVEVRDLESQVNDKLRQASKVMQELNVLFRDYKGLLPGINRAHDPIFQRLPPEIISYIFQYAVPDIPFDRSGAMGLNDTETIFQEVAARLVLGWVCKQWRQLAWSTPQLWTYILVNLEARDLKQHVGFFRDWLSRSGNLPLSIRVYGKAYSDPTPEVCDIIGLINKESSRWKMLDLRISAVFSTRFVGDTQCVGRPILGSLRLEHHDDPETAHNFQFNLMSTRPAPSNVFMMDVPYKSVHIQWDNVTYFEAEEVYLDDVFQLLQNAPGLQDLKLECISEDRGDFPLPDSIVVHRQLRDLTLRWPFHGVLHDFLSHINLPSLNRLYLRHGYEDHAGETIASFLKRSSCPLEILILTDTIYDTDELVSVLSEVPSLVSLDFFVEEELPDTGNFSPEAFFTLLAQVPLPPTSDTSSSEEIEEPQVSFLPNLRYLSFEPLDRFSWDLLPPIFDPFPQSSTLRRPLESFHFYDHGTFPSDSSPSLMDRRTTLALVAVKEAGLDLKIRYNGSDWLQLSAEHHGIPFDDHVSNDSDSE
ncbi:hypothetical protein CVT26_013377 [Gymnopilus dilepis]|uniref:Uncharacterized protein n=1 Tax=Gymnopilus dilepis TaxID=231916 RepID=A0A409VUX8_9AGAR|nr:hypothetical protein CVT26_013377 [Gymnopilus dilepis]